MTYRHLTVSVDENGIASITFDMAGKGANVLSMETVAEFQSAVESLSTNSASSVRGLVIQSGKPKQFIAGADIEEIASITDPKEAAEKARIGQTLMTTIENLPFPSVALIDGPCLGGGFELALSCDYRVAGDEPHVRLALPEVRLGIIPGFGGTQRLPRLIGLLPSLDWILTGKMFDARKALKAGAVDEAAPSALLTSIALQWLGRGKRSAWRTRLPRWMQAAEAIPRARRFLLDKARERVVKESGGHYPAPLRAIDVIGMTYRHRDIDGYSTEASDVGQLIADPISKSIIRLFQATEEIRKSVPKGLDFEIQKIGVVGAGVMGAGIAQLAAVKGIRVRLRDISLDFIAKGMRTIFELNQKELRRRRIDRREFELRNGRVSATTDHSGFRTADLVVEAIVESIDAKKKCFRELDRILPAKSVLASNTSALSISEIASATDHPDRVIGIHFFNPVQRMPLVEIIRGARTSDETVAKAISFAVALGKTPIVVADRPGFYVNRLLGTYLGEAARLAEEGVPFPAIESAAKRFGMPMGPFELMDEVGLDVAEKVGVYLSSQFEYFPKPSRLIAPLLEDGRLGKKSGRGFYVHEKDGRKEIDSVYLARRLEISNASGAEEIRAVDLIDRLILPMVNEAARCIEEKVVLSERDADVGMVLGTGFAPFRGGPIAYARAEGFAEIGRRLGELAERHGVLFRPSSYWGK